STVASIIALNQIDAIKSNNTSTFNVECLTCQEVCIGTSLNAKTEEQQDGQYKVTFTSLIENCGNVKLDGVTLSLDMKAMFGNTATYTFLQEPIANAGSSLSPNIAYNGSTITDILVKNSSSLVAQTIDTLSWVILVNPNGLKGP